MHADAESTSDGTDEDFFGALALLRSNEEGSVEKLRRMLDACIEKKYGPEKTLTARMSKKFLQKVESHDNTISMQAWEKRDHARKREMKEEIWQGSKTVPPREISEMESLVGCRKEDVKIIKVDYEDGSDEENIPRISIPERTFTDATLCKICNGAKLGPLILLECQDCQEAYHPLCHQPPVIDIDVYDPRFVWRCGRCVEMSSATSARIKIMNSGSVEKDRRDDGTMKENGNTPRLKVPGKSAAIEKSDSVKDKGVKFRKDSRLFAKDLVNVSQRNGDVQSSTQSRKRIGSKLSITRAPIK